MENRLKAIENAWMLESDSLYREKEAMLHEVLSFYRQAETKEDKKRVIDCLSKWNKSTNMLHGAVTVLAEFLSSNVEELLNGCVACITQFVAVPSLKHYWKLNDKKCAKLFEKLARARKPGNEETALILNNLLSIGLSTEKGISTFLKRAYPSLALFFTHLESYKHLDNAKKQVILTLKALFNKTGTQKMEQTFTACFADGDDSPKYLELFHSLQNCYESDLAIHAKTTYFKFIFQAFLKIPQLEDLEIKFFGIVSYLLAIPAFPDTVRIEQALGIAATENASNLPIWVAVLETISKQPLNLNLGLFNTTYIQWLKSVAVSLIKAEEFGVVQVDSLTALVELDSSIIEPYLAKIFKKLFTEEFLENEERRQSYQKFLLTTLSIFSRLQRTDKLLKKLLSAIASGSSSSPTHGILFEAFLNQLGKNSLVISSAQALNLMQLLIDQFQKCINAFQEDELNITLLDAVSLLLCTILTNCRLICSSLPRSVVEQFTLLIDNFKENLGQFGTLILLRTHDRKIMQPFLKICHVWGEYRVLVDLYASETGPPTLSVDATPSDLSSILPFLKGEQWSILSERIANFGDQQCNQLFMKLLILKIRAANLSNDKSCVNLEAIAKYILENLKQNVHGLKIDETFSPEEFGFVFNALQSGKEKTLVKILYKQLIASDDVIFESWIKNKFLLENPKFVELLFEIAVREISGNIQLKDLQQLLKSSNLKSVSEDLKTSINAVLREPRGNNENKLNDRVRKSLAALTSLPLGYIASFGDNPLNIVLGIMSALNSTHLLPIFEKLLSHSKTLGSSFDISSCVLWLTVHVPDRALRAPIVEQLVVKSTSTPSGIKTFRQLIKNLESDSRIGACEKLATQIHLHNAIRKCWRQGNDPEITEINDVIAKQRKKLNKSLHSALENGADIANDCVLLDAYGIELMRLEREGKIEGIVALNFQNYLDRALVGVKKATNDPEHQSCLNFLTTVLKCASALRQATSNQNFVFVIYKRLVGFENSVFWEHVCEAASDKEFQNIMNDVSKNVQLGLCFADSWKNDQAIPEELTPLVIKISEKNLARRWTDHYINVWKLFLQKSKGDKQKCCCSHLKRILKSVDNLLPKAGRKRSESLLKWLRFLHHVVALSIMTIRPELEDYVMDVMMAYPESGTDFQDHFVAQLNIMGALIAPQKIPAVRKMHTIFLVYQKLVRWLSRESDVNGNLSADNVSSRALAAFHLEKWIGLLVQRKDEFLVFPLYITELINFIANVTVYPPVKVHIRNAVFHLLAVMDEHQVKVILRNFNTGCQQIFTSLHAEFVKFHKYKGKI